MTTRQMVRAGCYPCVECRGWGRIMHGVVDATCDRCKGLALEPCANDRCRRPAYRGDRCRECSIYG